MSNVKEIERKIISRYITLLISKAITLDNTTGQVIYRAFVADGDLLEEITDLEKSIGIRYQIWSEIPSSRLFEPAVAEYEKLINTKLYKAME